MRNVATPVANLTLAITLLAAPLAPGALAAQQSTDPFLWLEEVEGSRALEWAEARNAETRAQLSTHPRYQQVFDQTMAILTSSDRIAFPTIRGEHLYNFWTDGEHPRGIYRRTSWADYLGGDPQWETVLDIDAIAEADGVPWALGGLFGPPMTCLEPENRRCLVALARGGSDAVEVREFDMVTRTFVEGGFRIPEGKSSATWVDEDHLLVATPAEGEATTSSGYAATTRLWTRGTPLTSGPVLFSAETEDMAVVVTSTHTGRGSEPTIQHLNTIFTTQVFFYRDGGLVRLDIPEDATPTFVGDQLVIQLVSDWTVGGRIFREGSLVSTDLEAYLAGERDIELVLEPDARSTVNGVTSTRDHLLVSMLTDVQGRLVRFRRADDGWTAEDIEMPPMGAVNVTARSDADNRFFFTYSSFVQPTTLYLADDGGGVEEVARLPAAFDAEGVVVEQFHATSADGTEVPYFVVRPGDLQMDGTNPTLLTAYGGFQISRTPSYLGATGKNWVEAGGVYVLANIRGGGEFGPAWWKAALKENRQRAYDDFIAVSEDLIARGVTAPAHLGIQGGSNGGLLVGVAMTQRPDLYNAVVVAVPLLDMRRYHTLLAGASWMAEYGDPDIPEEWAYISKYSPYQNVRDDGDYPEAFIWTTTRDDRVHPGHARKMTERLRSMGKAVTYFENTEGGHGGGVTPEQRAEIQALTYAYLFRQLADRRTAM